LGCLPLETGCLARLRKINPKHIIHKYTYVCGPSKKEPKKKNTYICVRS
jgi:hypothetical protein